MGQLNQKLNSLVDVLSSYADQSNDDNPKPVISFSFGFDRRDQTWKATCHASGKEWTSNSHREPEDAISSIYNQINDAINKAIRVIEEEKELQLKSLKEAAKKSRSNARVFSDRPAAK